MYIVLSNHCIVGDFIQIIFLSVIEFSIAVSYTKCCVLSFCDGLGDSFPILEYSYLHWNPYNRLLQAALADLWNFLPQSYIYMYIVH